jgi:hypothetical protein
MFKFSIYLYLLKFYKEEGILKFLTVFFSFDVDDYVLRILMISTLNKFYYGYQMKKDKMTGPIARMGK